MVLVKPINNYSEEIAIKEFVYSTFNIFPEVIDILKNATKGTLIVVKPNWIQEAHEDFEDVWEPVITHPNLVLAVLETIAEMTEGKGTICICDAPHTYANFDAIIERGGFRRKFEQFIQKWPGIHFELIDLRREVWVRKDGVVISRKTNSLDPRGYVCFNLGKDSLFYGFKGEGHYYGADYDVSPVNVHHRGGRQEYLLSGTAVKCDLFINLPKMKTHEKTGLTCSLKNLVGITGDKNFLPHHTKGSPSTGGDEFPDDNLGSKIEQIGKSLGQKIAFSFPMFGPYLYQKIRKIGMKIRGSSEKVIRNGNWQGNDTCWRMVLDLNRVFLYGDEKGFLKEKALPRPYLVIVDGIKGGEGDGPIRPEPVKSGCLVAGTNPAEVDAVVCRLMGFDPMKIPMVREAFAEHRFPISKISMKEIAVQDERLKKIIPLDAVKPAVTRGFKPYFGWIGVKENF